MSEDATEHAATCSTIEDWFLMTEIISNRAPWTSKHQRAPSLSTKQISLVCISLSTNRAFQGYFTQQVKCLDMLVDCLVTPSDVDVHVIYSLKVAKSYSKHAQMHCQLKVQGAYAHNQVLQRRSRHCVAAISADGHTSNELVYVVIDPSHWEEKSWNTSEWYFQVHEFLRGFAHSDTSLPLTTCMTH